jgi:predicted esterase
VLVGALGCHSTPADSKPARTSSPVIHPAPVSELGPPEPQPRPAAAEPVNPNVTPGLEPLAGEAPLVALPVPGFGEATVSLPLGATSPRPVVVALHGNFDRPEWQCEVWRGISGGFPFVLCPRGIPRRDAPKSLDRWEWASVDKTDRELEAALAALSERYGPYVSQGSVLFTGFSLGAILGAGILALHPERFRWAVLTEGGYDGWSASRARQFAGEGGARLLFACGQGNCLAKSRAATKVLERAGVEVRTADGGKAGHTYDGAVAEAVAREWTWLTSGDPRWRP